MVRPNVVRAKRNNDHGGFGATENGVSQNKKIIRSSATKSGLNNRIATYAVRKRSIRCDAVAKDNYGILGHSCMDGILPSFHVIELGLPSG
jgi:hypothetical protein